MSQNAGGKAAVRVAFDKVGKCGQAIALRFHAGSPPLAKGFSWIR
jgi:hypothetical protein